MRQERLVKRILSITLAVGIVLSNCKVQVVQADILRKNAKTNTTYALSESHELYDKLQADGFDLSQSIKESVDLSDSIYMPNIADQKGESCVAFASTYYQYSYEANRAKGITDETQAKSYSPYYIYSYLNGGVDNGIAVVDAYKRLQEVGSVEWEYFEDGDSGFTFGGENEEYEEKYKELVFGYEEDVAAMRNALTMKVDNFYEYTEEYESGENYSAEEKLEVVKKLLSNGVMILSRYNAYQVAMGYTMDEKEEDIVYRMSLGGLGGHCVVIVGYDDSIEMDLDGDGKADAQGAFKVANW